jgi:hypothetical protein
MFWPELDVVSCMCITGAAEAGWPPDAPSAAIDAKSMAASMTASFSLLLRVGKSFFEPFRAVTLLLSRTLKDKGPGYQLTVKDNIKNLLLFPIRKIFCVSCRQTRC